MYVTDGVMIISIGTSIPINLGMPGGRHLAVGSPAGIPASCNDRTSSQRTLNSSVSDGIEPSVCSEILIHWPLQSGKRVLASTLCCARTGAATASVAAAAIGRRAFLDEVIMIPPSLLPLTKVPSHAYAKSVRYLSRLDLRNDPKPIRPGRLQKSFLAVDEVPLVTDPHVSVVLDTDVLDPLHVFQLTAIAPMHGP